MSRNEEKARGALNRWKEAAAGRLGHRGARRAEECDSLPEADAKRRELVQAISVKVGEIQNKMLDPERIKALNDEINKLMRVKGHWERQIRALGGPDYAAQAGGDSRDVVRVGNYIYFGAAKDLPEVEEKLRARRRGPESGGDGARGGGKFARADVALPPAKDLDAEYYGLTDDADLVVAEAEASAAMRKRLRGSAPASASASASASAPASAAQAAQVRHWNESWRVPTSADVDKAVLEHKKRALVRRFA